MTILGRERTPERLANELDRMATAAASALADALDCLDSRDIAKANQVIDAAHLLTKERDQILHELTSKRGRVAVGLAYVLESLERSAFYASDLAEIAINRAVESSQAEVPGGMPVRAMAAPDA